MLIYGTGLVKFKNQNAIPIHRERKSSPAVLLHENEAAGDSTILIFDFKSDLRFS